MQTQLYPPQRVSEMLCISIATLRKWRWEGKGPKFIKVGRKVAYREADVSDFIQNQLRSSTSDPGTMFS
jgi:predicted site-specific integrase-resolvase